MIAKRNKTEEAEEGASIEYPRSLGAKPKAVAVHNRRFSREISEEALTAQVQDMTNRERKESSSSDESHQQREEADEDEDEDLIDDMDLFSMGSDQHHSHTLKMTPDQLRQLRELTGLPEEQLEQMTREQLKEAVVIELRRKREEKERRKRGLTPEEMRELEEAKEREAERRQQEERERKEKLQKTIEEREAKRAEELAKIDKTRHLLVERDMRARANRSDSIDKAAMEDQLRLQLRRLSLNDGGGQEKKPLYAKTILPNTVALEIDDDDDLLPIRHRGHRSPSVTSSSSSSSSVKSSPAPQPLPRSSRPPRLEDFHADARLANLHANRTGMSYLN